MTLHVAAADGEVGLWNRLQGQQAEEVNKSEVVEQLWSHLRGHEQCYDRSDQHEDHVDFARGLVNRRTFCHKKKEGAHHHARKHRGEVEEHEGGVGHLVKNAS